MQKLASVTALALALVLASGAAACGPAQKPPPVIANSPGGKATPADAGRLTSARTILIKDTWMGLGCTHSFAGELVATGAGFRGDVELSAGWGGEGGRKATVTVPREVVAELEEAVTAAQAALAGAPPEPARGMEWTDDYPSGSITFAGPAGTFTIGFTDQHRILELEHDGKTVRLDRARSFDQDGAGPSRVWEAYQAVLAAAQMRQMIEEACHRG